MSVFAELTVTEAGVLVAIRELMAQLLTSGMVKAVMVPLETRDGRSVQPAVVTDPARLSKANPLLPVLPLSGARMASLITERLQVEPDGEASSELPRIAVVMRPCELRAAVELAKLRQLNFVQLLTIGVDCAGTYEFTAVGESAREPAEIVDAALEAARSASADAPGELPYRHACTICTNPVAWKADISLHTIGVQAVLVELADDALMAPLGLTAAVDAPARQQAVDALIATRQAHRDAVLDEVAVLMQPREDGTPGLVEVFETCLTCRNCSTACPICYCKECLFRTSTFAHEPRRYLGWAERKGAARLPGDTMTFQLTRLSHVTTSCVGCGLCTSACPAHLPVDALFQAVARQTQALFDYVAGRDIAEPLPATTFRRDELVELGEAKRR